MHYLAGDLDAQVGIDISYFGIDASYMAVTFIDSTSYLELYIRHKGETINYVRGIFLSTDNGTILGKLGKSALLCEFDAFQNFSQNNEVKL